jgi:hypothetical protein
MSLWEVSLADFVIVTIILGGGAAWLTGRATALIWAPYWKLFFYVVLLNIALRFIHFSLFGGTFFLPLNDFDTAIYYAAVDFIVLLASASLGRRITRARQMARQYGFLYEPAGRFGWRERAQSRA